VLVDADTDSGDDEAAEVLIRGQMIKLLRGRERPPGAVGPPAREPGLLLFPIGPSSRTAIKDGLDMIGTS
jgi:hypothetical protein